MKWFPFPHKSIEIFLGKDYSIDGGVYEGSYLEAFLFVLEGMDAILDHGEFHLPLAVSLGVVPVDAIALRVRPTS